MRQIIKLLDRGEERLLNAVENNKIPLNVALQIVETPDSEIQRVLQEAYSNTSLRNVRCKTHFSRSLSSLCRRSEYR